MIPEKAVVHEIHEKHEKNQRYTELWLATRRLEEASTPPNGFVRVFRAFRGQKRFLA